jgi:hypothetical protein
MIPAVAPVLVPVYASFFSLCTSYVKIQNFELAQTDIIYHFPPQTGTKV